MRGALVDHPPQRLPQDLELLVAPHHRRVEVADVPHRVGHDLEEPEGRDRLGLALQGEGVDRLHADRVLHEPMGRAAEQHLAGAGRLLEAGRHVHGVARHEPLSGARVARDHLAGVHPDPDADLDAVIRAQLFVQRVEGTLHAVGGPHRAERVVLVEPRDAEDRHHGVADVLLDRAAVPLDHLGHRVEVARLHAVGAPRDRAARRSPSSPPCRRTRSTRPCGSRSRTRPPRRGRPRTRGRTSPGRDCPGRR